MFNPVSRLKKRLSHVREDRWHYQAFSMVWGRKAESWVKKKACTYYWFYLPTSFLAIGFLSILMVVIWAIGAFLGYRPKFRGGEDKPGSELFYPHKRWSNGKKMHVTPFEAVCVLFTAGFVFLGGLWIADNLYTVKLVGIGIACLLALGAFVYLFLKGWNVPVIKKTRGIASISASRFWGWACPTLIVEPSEANEAEESPQPSTS
ncbi:MAG: hypothetical protein HZC02_05100 [Candidatus Levybacteria bacterium]|nr:hypothetical protein [Candidatus Levybacteria bacterium]